MAMSPEVVVVRLIVSVRVPMMAAPMVKSPPSAVSEIDFPSVKSWMVPEVVSAPELEMAMLPPVSLIPVIFKGPLLSRVMSPLKVLVALKPVTAFAAVLRSVPVVLDVVSKPPVITAVFDWMMLVDAVRFTSLVPAAMVPVRSTWPPALLTATVPVPVWLIPVTERVAAPSFRLIAPVPVLVALKLVTELVLSSTVPVLDQVVSRLPVINPAPASLIAPPAVMSTLSSVVTLPAFSVTS